MKPPSSGMAARDGPAGYRLRNRLQIRAFRCLFPYLFLAGIPALGQTLPDRPPPAREGEKPSIYQVFDREMEHYRSMPPDTTMKHPVWSVLPAWLTTEIGATPGILIMPGISDPGLPPALAYRQASTRALSMALLARGCTGSYISDLYAESSGTKAGSRFEEIYGFVADARQPLKTMVMHDTILASGEVALLVCVEVDEEREKREKEKGEREKGEGGSAGNGDQQGLEVTDDPWLAVSAFLYNFEFSSEGGSNWLRKSELVSRSAAGEGVLLRTDSLAFYQVDRRFMAAANLQKSSGIDFGRREYYYGMAPGAFRPAGDDSGKVESRQAGLSGTIPGDSLNAHRGTNGNIREVYGTSCEWGLWLAFTDQVVDALAFYLKKNTVQTGTVTDQTPAVNHALNREMQRLSLRYALRQVSLSENRLKVMLDITP